MGRTSEALGPYWVVFLEKVTSRVLVLGKISLAAEAGHSASDRLLSLLLPPPAALSLLLFWCPEAPLLPALFVCQLRLEAHQVVGGVRFGWVV